LRELRSLQQTAHVLDRSSSSLSEPAQPTHKPEKTQNQENSNLPSAQEDVVCKELFTTTNREKKKPRKELVKTASTTTTSQNPTNKQKQATSYRNNQPHTENTANPNNNTQKTGKTLTCLLYFQSKNFVAISAFRADYLKAVQNIELAYAVPALLCVVTDELTDSRLPLLVHLLLRKTFESLIR
jgi:hypothetical protein